MSLYNRVYNFSAGPGTLPVPVLELVRDEMLNQGESGMSVLEMSHRGGPYDRIHAEAQADLRALLGVPDDYHILFLQGGASLQFTMVARSFGQGDYIVTGAWGEKAYESAKIEGEATVVWDDKANGYRRAPEVDEVAATPGANFVHITSNETIGGVQWKQDPQFGLPLVCDMSSDILSRPVDVARYGLIFAGAQKNMGPAGATLVIIHDDFLKRVPKGLPPMLDYALQAKNDSRYNTPPTFSIYVCGLVYKHLLALGGLGVVAAHNERKAGLIYDAIDASGGFYRGHAAHNARSTMNVVFTLPDEERTKRFVAEAESHGFDGLKGHRSVGGIRASVYNAFPEAGCEALAVFMREFAAKNG
jgi:phosphoserine aminotransferase